MNKIDKQAVSPPPPAAKAGQFPAGFVRMVECCLVMAVLLVILIVIAPRFFASLTDFSPKESSLTVVVMSASDVVKNQWHLFVPLAGAIMAGLLVMPFVWPARLTAVISIALLITVSAATVAVLLGIYLPLMGLYGAGLK